MVHFARVDGIVTIVGRAGTVGTVSELLLRLVVTLDDGRKSRVVRDETLRALRPVDTLADLKWHADQWTQETIGVDLAGEGWEPVSLGAPGAPDSQVQGIGHSPTYVVRRL
jgi:hypothetical protein